ncbi:acetyl-CoA/propionyl-CoA carboxylase biotin carboxyl carrier protein [Lipingzhangella halophila]|uniref:biotin carboxylase n=2 Tax=Lipingzhangella halophila TaxID=1783352 RepID=A0A7W7W2F4_9ACTN|nr:biotin carboxylase N-terminal domain-containing protein [Lipingzhangella halophila]MBB4930719.1 acetyl-CoA/propionyl-CoA carboxylase biotin carboxyl carrier protein [Lipingzhangella halophila]
MSTGSGTQPAGATTVLVANRGEIAVRVMRTLRKLGMRSVAIHSDGDAGAAHTRAADSAIRVGGAELADSYLNGAAIIEAARATGAEMIHPGYGFLAENAGFARACADAGLTFVGPPPAAIEAMGDKIRAKDAVSAAGVPLLPGFTEESGHPLDDADLARAAEQAGYPLLLKPSAGGGGKGMRLVRDPAELPEAAAAARREARAAFGDATLLAERFVDRPRHIEIQVLADGHGNVVHLGERECSLQRRHQKIVEEAPSPLLTADQRAAMGEAAVAAAKACGYVGAGTVEFVVRPPAEGTGEAAPTLDYAFLEMNTRLQVEHPVTEAVGMVAGQRGIDLVELQLRVALGERLPFSQADFDMAGHALEARVYAEDPAHGFVPTGGRVLLLSEPGGADVRVDSGVTTGTRVTPIYDPLLAKVVTWGPDRAATLRRMDTALADYTLLGCRTNVGYLRALLRHPRVVSAELSTDLTERARHELLPDGDEVPDEVYAAAALDHQLGLEPSAAVTDRFDVPDNWRMGERAWTTWRLRAPRLSTVAVAVRRAGGTGPAPLPLGGALDYEVRVGDAAAQTARAARSGDGRELTVTLGGRTVRYTRAADDGSLWLGYQGRTWELREEPAFAPIREREATGDGTVRSPMPGTVLAVPVEDGQRVTAGTPVAVVEAMKMEHTVTAPVGGVVTLRDAHPGSPVAMDAILATIEPEPAQDSPGPTAESATHEE